MSYTAAHLVDHAIPNAPMRRWVEWQLFRRYGDSLLDYNPRHTVLTPGPCLVDS